MNFQPQHLDKIFWPKEGYTKGDLLKYYEKIAPVILPYLKDRPQSLLRHVNGATHPGFFQKNVLEHPKFVKTVTLKNETDKRPVHYVICNDEQTLLYLANLGCIELNPWSSRVKKINYPDFAILDLDPQSISFAKVVEVAQVAHELLEEMRVANFCKTSGKTGLHICIPLGAKYTYEHAREFCHGLAMNVNQKLPKTTSLERAPKKRKGKVYLDFLQNKIGSTIASVYSVRPYPGATVSTPLLWEEVNGKLNPRAFTIKTVFKRLDQVGDLWKPLLGKAAHIPR